MFLGHPGGAEPRATVKLTLDYIKSGFYGSTWVAPLFSSEPR